MVPVSFEAYATQRPSGENWAFRTVHFACRKGLVVGSGQARYHNSFDFLISTHFPSRDQSQGLTKAVPRSATNCWEPEPSACLRYSWLPLLRLNRICLPSGLQIGA